MKTRWWANWCANLVVTFVAGLSWGNAQRLVTAEPTSIRASFAAHPANCLFFFVEDCPVSMRDFGLVGELRAQYDTTALQLIAVYVGDHGERLQAIADSVGMPLLYANDHMRKLVSMADASITPEYFLFDAAGLLRYRGAIDDYAIGLGKHKRLAQKHYLSDAITAVLAGQQVVRRATQPVGCVIEGTRRN